MVARWYVVQTRAAQDDRAWESVSDLGYETWYPTYSVPGRPRQRTPDGQGWAWRRKTAAMLRPLYPGYLFVEIEDAAKGTWGPIMRARGVFTILGVHRNNAWPSTGAAALNSEGYAGTPLAMPVPVMPKLRAWYDEFEASNVAFHETNTRAYVAFIPGERVSVLLGDVERAVTALVQRDRGKRIRVLLDMLGRSTPTSVPRESVRRAGSGGQMREASVLCGRDTRLTKPLAKPSK